jgi:hypothetical protein
MYGRVINIFFRFFSKYSTSGRIKASAVGWRKIQIEKKMFLIFPDEKAEIKERLEGNRQEKRESLERTPSIRRPH